MTTPKSLKYKFLIVSPGIEDGGMRGLGRVTFSVIDSLKLLDAEVFLLTGAPKNIVANGSGRARNVAERRSLDHYLTEGISSAAFKLTKLSILKSLVKDALLLVTGTLGIVSNSSHLPSQHEPHALRQFMNLEGYVNFGLFYKISRKLPIGLRSYVLLKIAAIAGMDAIITASPFPIKRPFFIGRKIKIVQFLHDVMPLNVLETPPDSMMKFARDFTASMSSADLVLTSSQNAENKLSYLLPNIRSKVVYLPSESPVFRKRIHAQNIITSDERISGKYILFISTLEKRKNVARMIEAFSIISAHNDYSLVIVGSKGYGWDEIEATIDSLSADTRKRIVIKGYVTEYEKWGLLKGCKFVLHPAIDEGLGIPAIESMIAKKPIIATRLNSLEEFTPDGVAIYIEDPYDVIEIADKMMHMINNIDQFTQNAIRESAGVQKFFSSYEFCKRLRKALNMIDIQLNKPDKKVFTRPTI